jgi:hypothetical protein
VTTPLTELSARGFVVRLSVLLAAAYVVSWAVALLDLSGPLRQAPAASVALILALTYVWRPVEALAGLAVFMLFRETYARYLGVPIGPVDELAVGFIFLVAAMRAARSWRAWMSPPRDIAVLCVLLLGTVASLIAGVPVATWSVALVLVGKSMAFLYAVMWTRMRDWEIRGAMIAVLAVGLVVLGLGWIELVDARGFREFLGLNHYPSVRGGTPVVKSLFVHPAPYGYLTAFIGLFLAAQFVITRRWRWLALAVAFTTGPLLSARRRAILALVAGIVTGVVESVARLRSPLAVVREWAPVVVGVILVLALFTPGLVGLYELTLDRYVTRDLTEDEIEDLPPGADGDTSPQARIALYRGSAEIGADYFPLGAGLGRYASWMSRVDYSPLYEEYGLSGIKGLTPDDPRFATDTFWPQILGETGVLGLVAYLVFLGSIALVLWREARRRDGDLYRLLTLGAGMVFAQAIIESLASSMFHSPPRVYLFYLVVGAVLSIAWRRDQPTDDA